MHELEKFHLKFCKRILGVHAKSTNVAVYAELGRLPLIVPISVQIVKYWLNITGHSMSNHQIFWQNVTQHFRFCSFLYY